MKEGSLSLLVKINSIKKVYFGLWLRVIKVFTAELGQVYTL